MNAPLARYDAMIQAIAECERVDEAKDIRDKAVALQAYYRQAGNMEAERKACNVRLRAERQAGLLLKELARAETPNPSGRNQHEVTSQERTQPASPFAQTLADTGMSRQQAHRFQALANVPEAEFEAALADPEKPTASGILARVDLKADPPPETTRPQVSEPALWLWGRLREFERDGYLRHPAPSVLDTMTDAMRADVRRLAPLVSDFLVSLGERP